MRIVGATEARRSLGALLDHVESGETVLVTRRGKHVALIERWPGGNGAALRDLLARVPDDAFERDVAAARTAVE